MHWFASFLSKEAIKRESGANPGQSRCCKFHIMLQAINSLHATGSIFREGCLQQKQVRRPAMHCFIIAFEEKALSLMNRIIHPIISFIKTLSKKVKENKLCQVYLNDVRPK
jgi:hypothetical protein